MVTPPAAGAVPISVIPEADRVLGRAPMFQLDQLVPVARFTADPVVLAVRADAPWKSFAEFVAFARAHPKSSTTGRPATTAPCMSRWRCSPRVPVSA